MSNKYIPTKWVANETIGTANVMNNIEQGITGAYDEIERVDSQLAHIVGEVLYISDSISDFGEYLNNIDLSKYSVIELRGDVNIQTPIDFNLKSLLTINGNGYSINVKKDMEYCINFNICSNININNLTINGNNHQLYKTINFDKCKHVNIFNIKVKDIFNKDVEKITYNIYINSFNFNVNSVTFENIKTVALKEYEKTGKGSINNLYIRISNEYRVGNISNVFSYNCHNVDIDNNVLKVDCDTIKTQYEGGIDYYIDSMLTINNVYGVDFGKRLIKLQTGGVFVYNVEGITNNIDTESIIGIHHKNIHVENIFLKNNYVASSCFIETGIYASDITIKNCRLDGNVDRNVISLGYDLRLDSSNNITIDGLDCCNLNSRDFITFAGNCDNIKIKNIKAKNCVFSDDILRVISKTITSKLGIELYNFNIDCVAKNIMVYNLDNNETLNLKIENSNILFSCEEDFVNSYLCATIKKGSLKLINTVLEINNNNYLYDCVRLRGFDVALLDNFELKLNNVTSNKPMSLYSTITKLYDCNFNALSFDIKSKLCDINSVNANIIYLSKLDGVNEQHYVSVTSFPYELYLDNDYDFIILNSDTFSLKANVEVVNGSGLISLGKRFRSVKVLNTISTVDCYAIRQSTTAFDKLDLICKDKSFNGVISVEVIYQR